MHIIYIFHIQHFGGLIEYHKHYRLHFYCRPSIKSIDACPLFMVHEAGCPIMKPSLKDYFGGNIIWNWKPTAYSFIFIQRLHTHDYEKGTPYILRTWDNSISDKQSILLQYFSKHTTIKSKEKINHDRPVRQEREKIVFVILGIEGILWLVMVHSVRDPWSRLIQLEIPVQKCKLLFTIML